MQRRAAAAYVAFFVVIAAGAFGATAIASSPDISIDPDHELSQGQPITVDGTSYNATEVDASATPPTATIEWTANGENQSASVSEGQTVTLGETEFVAHFEGETLQLTTDKEAYQNQVEQIDAHEKLMHDLSVVATLSGLTGFVMLALAYMPTRRD